ncbi:nucleotidyltransferase family protein [Pseudohoeflea coraliihabitans]|uniref:Nucleotidyltransferase family protein n=1 Tax=Pseudohoeflea coraliihabitans TaxID=2860393 RepID=A0ABS6WM03_9HYPH|nr:nucleotidyltransferase family protein [Pseudohoeflea sp. DP4N28-3]MBW3096815.1 nucleotidyltransferase family protein [Pseudohoeflea sp. DP4N28-3]
MRLFSARFPDYGWAWPTGARDDLLKAVMLTDAAEAETLALAWLKTHDINDVSFAEHRLLAAMAERHGQRLKGDDAYPRLIGLQKMLWSRSRLTYRAARPALVGLRAAGCGVMLLKGASRVALDAGAQRGRVSHDVDILVRREHMAAALDCLFEAGWTAASGAGQLRLKARIAALRGLNFYKGTHGDLDLHQKAYHPSQFDDTDDLALWERSVAAQLEGVDVRVPGPADRIALAIGHSGLEAHVHSDWLVDIDAAVQGGDVDWQALLSTLAARGLFVPAAISLSYLKRQVGTPVPDDVLAAVIEKADRSSLAERAAILEAKPRDDFGILSGPARGVVKQMRLLRNKVAASGPKETVWLARARRCTDASSRNAKTTVARLSLPVSMRKDGPRTLEIRLALSVPQQGRRVEFELTTSDRFLASLRYRTVPGLAGGRQLWYRGTVDLQPGDQTLRLEARPSRHLRSLDNSDEVARYGLLPFTLVYARVRDEAGAEFTLEQL